MANSLPNMLTYKTAEGISKLLYVALLSCQYVLLEDN